MYSSTIYPHPSDCAIELLPPKQMDGWVNLCDLWNHRLPGRSYRFSIQCSFTVLYVGLLFYQNWMMRNLFSWISLFCYHKFLSTADNRSIHVTLICSIIVCMFLCRSTNAQFWSLHVFKCCDNQILWYCCMSAEIWRIRQERYKVYIDQISDT